MNGLTITETNLEEAVAIIELFNKNYKNGYYNSNFKSEEKLCNLISKENFIGLTVKLEKEIIGFSGIYICVESNINKIYLAHFLVDENHRYKGIGKIIDRRKEAICEAIYGKSIVYSILGLSSLASLEVKKTSGYSLWGVRLFYGEWEPNQDNVGHLAVVGKLIRCGDKVHEFPNLNEGTQKLIKSSGIKCIFKNINRTLKKYVVRYPDDIEFGQYACTIKRIDDLNKEGEVDLQTVIDYVLKNKEYPYIALRINTQLLTAKNEEVLYRNGFYPTSFLAFFDNGEDMLEYQYIIKDKVDKISNFLPNKVEILEHINF